MEIQDYRCDKNKNSLVYEMTGRSEMNYFEQNIADNIWHRTDQYSCPYHSTSASICSASLTMMIVGIRTKQGYCENENYDNCPLVLSKMLRKRG